MKETTPELKYTEAQMTEVRLERDNNWNLHLKDQERIKELEKELSLSKETENQAVEKLLGEKEALRFTKEKYVRFVEKCASLLGSTADEEGVIKFMSNYSGVLNELNEAKDENDRQKKAHEIEVLEMSSRLNHLNNQIEEMKHEHLREIQKMQEALSTLQKQVENSHQKERSLSLFDRFLDNVLSVLRNTKQR